MPKAVKHPKLRESLEGAEGIKVGTVLILLAGRFRGKRVVLLKKDEKTGTLVVTGPYKVNGVPIRRVDPAYVIATSTKVDLPSIDLSAIGADYFARPKKNKKGDELAAKAQVAELPEEKKATQKKVDEQVMKALEKTPDMAKYIKDTFTLRDHDVPHRMCF
eukprot:TRINITY_DN32078_c0_g1_i1.p2 TRINITY_DN32078_c0_g1~~TRINITY_DN32078_c0_g1_i1.p2  ORF type:complete len:161 (+),score=72.10 TRINITY_DN32078_c0_g1_i1:68-550(+)